MARILEISRIQSVSAGPDPWLANLDREQNYVLRK